MSITKNLGAVTAYADAVAAGYTGTREQWAEDMANLGDNLAEVRESKNTAVQAAETAIAARDAAIENVNDARDAAVVSVNSARDAAIESVNSAAETAENSAVEAIGQAADDKTAEINAIGAVRFDGYQPLTSDEQATARSNIDAGGAIVETAQGDGTVTVEDSAHAALHGLRIFGKSTQDGTPSPDAPVPIVSVGDDGAIDTLIRGANLFDASRPKYSGVCKLTQTESGLRATTVNAQSYTNANILIDVPVGMTITIASKWTASANNKGGIRLMYVESSGAAAGAWGLFSTTSERAVSGVVAEASTETAKLAVLLYGNTDGDATAGDYVDYTDVQVVVGEYTTDTMPAYQPYTEQILPVSTPNGLPGIPVDSDGNYTDADGQQWVCDEVDFGRGVYVQRVGVIQSYNSETVETVYLSSTGELSEGAQVLYVLATPIETSLTEEELASYRALRTQCPTTNVTNDEGAGMEVSYAADTKTYIDNKFAELSAAILNA